MLLSHYFRQVLGAPFAVKDLRGHDALIILHNVLVAKEVI
jgi:hypothetical protein